MIIGIVFELIHGDNENKGDYDNPLLPCDAVSYETEGSGMMTRGNPYHDAEGKFCSKNGMKAAITCLVQRNRLSEALALQSELDKIEETKRQASHVMTEKFVSIPCAFDMVTVVNGDLTNEKTRYLLINGLCGDLAKAIHEKTGGDVYFVCDTSQVRDSRDLATQFTRNPHYLINTAMHAMVESPRDKGVFLDAYGRKNTHDLQQFYGKQTKPIKGAPAMLDVFSTGVSGVLSEFADSVITLDAQGKSYPYLPAE